MASNMYPLSVKQFNPFVGCKFDCVYCRKSFQAQAKRQKHRCQKCYNYEPHEHPERLTQRLPKTGYGQFIFTCASGDISFCSTEYLNRIVDKIRSEPDKNFLIQSKNPKTFGRIDWPDNVILGTTIETNRHSLAEQVSKAPLIVQRWLWLGDIKCKRMLTFEPILDFDTRTMLTIVDFIHPAMVWIGYDTKKTGLPEPPVEKVKELYWQLGKLGFTVMLKKMR